jgi:hypothetical protein
VSCVGWKQSCWPCFSGQPLCTLKLRPPHPTQAQALFLNYSALGSTSHTSLCCRKGFLQVSASPGSWYMKPQDSQQSWVCNWVYSFLPSHPSLFRLVIWLDCLVHLVFQLFFLQLKDCWASRASRLLPQPSSYLLLPLASLGKNRGPWTVISGPLSVLSFSAPSTGCREEVWVESPAAVWQSHIESP